VKALFKVLLFSVALVLFFTQYEKEPDPNEPFDIPDQAFLNVLIEEGIDTNGDGLISYTEAEEIITLDISDRDLSDMTGIKKFINLDTLRWNKNQITTLDVSNNVALTHLNCGENQLTSLDVSNCIDL